MNEQDRSLEGFYGTFAEIEPLSLSDRVINALRTLSSPASLSRAIPLWRGSCPANEGWHPVVREALIALQGRASCAA